MALNVVDYVPLLVKASKNAFTVMHLQLKSMGQGILNAQTPCRENSLPQSHSFGHYHDHRHIHRSGITLYDH